MPPVEPDEDRAAAVPDVVRFMSEELGVVPDSRQAEVLRCDSKRVILNCPRQWGKSTCAAGKAIHRAYTEPGILIVFASASERQAAEFVGKAGELLERMGIRARGDGKNRISLKLPNKSRIVGLPPRQKTVRGFSGLSLLMIDEASGVPDEMYLALRPMLATKNGSLWLMSTPAGKRGFFYDTWEHGGDLWTRFQAPVTECDRIPAEFLEEERRVHGDLWFRQEYLCEFVDMGGSLFGRELVEGALETMKEWRLEKGAIPRAPEDVRGPVFVAVDLGKIGDFTAIAVVEREEKRLAWMPSVDMGLRVRYLERMALGTPYTVVAKRIQEIVAVAEAGGQCSVVVDATGVGEPVVDMLRESRLRCRLTAVSITGGEKAHGKGGWWHVPRHDLLGGVQVLLEQGELKIAKGLKDAGALVKELTSMQTDGKGAGHDDLAMAVALGCWAARRPENGYGGQRLPGI
jgi:hypothetical protein